MNYVMDTFNVFLHFVEVGRAVSNHFMYFNKDPVFVKTNILPVEYDGQMDCCPLPACVKVQLFNP